MKLKKSILIFRKLQNRSKQILCLTQLFLKDRRTPSHKLSQKKENIGKYSQLKDLIQNQRDLLKNHRIYF